MALIDVEVNSVQLQKGIITITCSDVSYEHSDRLERVRADENGQEAIFVFDSHNFKEFEYLSNWLHSQKASKGASTWGEALNSIVGTRTQIASNYKISWC